jgi:hypothetical protein
MLLASGSLIMGLAWNVALIIPGKPVSGLCGQLNWLTATRAGLVLYAAGFAYPVLVRSIVTSFASINDIPVTILFSGLAYAETLGSFVGATVLTAGFTATLQNGGILAGMPFFLSAVRLFSICACHAMFDFPNTPYSLQTPCPRKSRV